MDTLNTFCLADLMAWVENQTGAVVNFEDLSGITREIPCLRLREDQHAHHGPYCEFAKTNGHMAKCVAFKRRSFQRAKRGKPYASVCPLGIWDWIQPVLFRKELLGILYLGSLRAGAKPKTIGKRVYGGPAIPPVNAALRRTLRQQARFLRDTILLIIAEWERTGHSLTKRKSLDYYRNMVRLYIRHHYHEPLRVSDLARQLRVHPYYLGQVIRKAYGQNFHSLLLEHRVKEAKILLLAGHYTVTEIAFKTGFHDSNYFSTVFRRLTGQSPRQFRERSANRMSRNR